MLSVSNLCVPSDSMNISVAVFMFPVNVGNYKFLFVCVSLFFSPKSIGKMHSLINYSVSMLPGDDHDDPEFSRELEASAVILLLLLVPLRVNVGSVTLYSL